MNAGVLPDASTPFGRRVHDHLDDDRVVWLTTVGATGTPQPNPVWFVRDGDDVLIYNYRAAKRLTGINDRPQVSLHFNTDDDGEDVVVLAGRAAVDEQAPPPHESTAYVAKYGTAMERISGSAEAFSRTYSVPTRVRITRVRGF